MTRLRLGAALCLLAAAGSARAVGPADVYILVNKNVPASRELAEYYCLKRGVSRDHILALNLCANEDVSRLGYDRDLAGPLRALLKDRRDKVKVLLCMYGVPLRVDGPVPSPADKAELARVGARMATLQKQQGTLQARIRDLEPRTRADPPGAAARELADARTSLAGATDELAGLEQQRRYLTVDRVAAVDSELSLLWYGRYELGGWQPNLLNFRQPPEARAGKPPLVMTARLDGTSPALVKRLIDDALAAEKKGLQGKVYVDAQGSKYDPATDSGAGYGAYDESMREMAALLRRQGRLPVTLDNRPALFAPGACPDCALYCGWYSHARFIDCCRFVPGAVAFHLASSEAISLRNPKVPFWCKNQLEHGAAATLGPVGEPYTLGFPKPAEFFGLLATGEYTLVEAYWRTTPCASWMMTLVGDPLYNPFAKDPRLKSAQVKPSPAGETLRFGTSVR